MDRKQYNTCLLPWMKKDADDQDERRLNFCIGAKLCAGKAESEDEARRVCLLPKPPKAPTGPKKAATCEKQAMQVTECVVHKITGSYKNAALNINSVGQVIALALMECQCQQD